jgi:hypothetical protein
MNHKLVRWLLKKPLIFSFSTNKDILDDMIQVFYQFIDSSEDLILNVDPEIFSLHFYICMFQDKYPPCSLNYEEIDYISTKYGDQVVDLFIKLRDMSDAQGFQFFRGKNETSDKILQLLTSTCNIMDTSDIPEHEDELDIDDEYY